MRLSHSRVELFKRNPFEFKKQYIDKVTLIKDFDRADHPLIIGNALHKGIETSAQEAIQEYYFYYPIINDLHVNEAIKLEQLIPKVKDMIPDGEHEVQLLNEDFTGFIDLVAHNDDGTVDLYDFKYSNNVENYMDSAQLHLYKYFYERQFGKEVRNLYYIFVPKTWIRQKKDETIIQFRQRLKKTLKPMQPKLIEIEYDASKVIEFLIDAKHAIEATEYPLLEHEFWKYSEWKKILEGADYMVLPSSNRRDISKPKRKVIWLYGQPFTGKTTFANQFPTPLMLNTDGNIEYVDAPYISIKDVVKTEGRRTTRKLAWNLFKETITELEKNDNDFETIIVDLTEDTYEFARLFIYDREGLSHESDDSFRAWDMVTNEFLNTFRRLMNLDYENIIIISHEDSSKDITKRSGENITAIKPNIREKVATKLAGMVDIVGRVVAEPDGTRLLSFKSDEVVFGGGRLPIDVDVIELDVDEFEDMYAQIEFAAPKKSSKRKAKKEESVEEPEEIEEVEVKKLSPEDLEDMKVTELKDFLDDEGVEYPSRAKKDDLLDILEDHLFGSEDDSDDVEEVDEEEPQEEEETTTRSRRRRVEADEVEEEVEEEPEEDEAPRRRRRKRR